MLKLREASNYFFREILLDKWNKIVYIVVVYATTVINL